ncbi:cytochrome P450 6B3-like, partial [Nasonia vitripennis]|uniref:Cytochrome P450 n=1 Tax=Nasonia vitripennis TaxID=7425 RepID=A0A7M7Q5H0_NASVI
FHCTETLRKYPPGSIVQRRSNASYTFTGTEVTTTADTTLIIPVWAIHHDPDLYPNPEIFEPERFNEDNEGSRHPMNCLPFGNGPHNCIGKCHVFITFIIVFRINAGIIAFQRRDIQTTRRKWGSLP